MERSLLKAIIVDHKERFLAEQEYVPRTLTNRLLDNLDKPEIIVITGVRRSGKSTLMKLVCREMLHTRSVAPAQVLYLNFEDERFLGFQETDYSALLEAYYELEQPASRKYFFLDEIHNLSGWERWLARLYESGEIKIFVSGSNASLLSPEIGARLTGRNRQIVTWPFSFQEFRTFRKRSTNARSFYRAESKALLRSDLEAYLIQGGFPEPVKQADSGLLQQYYQDILYRDIAFRYQVRHLRELKELAFYLASNPASIHSYESLRRLIGSRSVTTVKNHLEILENVFLFFRLQLFDFSVKRQIYNPGKFYLIDTGLFNAMAYRFSENRGHLLENLIYIELRRREKEIFYWKSRKGNEVDFIIRHSKGALQAVQVCLSFQSAETRERECRALVLAGKELGVKELLVLSAEDEPGSLTMEGITINIIPVWQWLLEEENASTS